MPNNPDNLRRIAILQDRDGRDYEVAESSVLRVGKSVVDQVWDRLRGNQSLLARRSAISSNPYRMFIFNPDTIANVREAQQ